MASPEPEKADAAVKAGDAATEKESKPETNGHKSPTPANGDKEASKVDDTKDEDKKGDKETSAATSDEKKSDDSSSAKDAAKDATKESKAATPSVERPTESPKEKDVSEAPRESEPASKSPEPAASKDVDMGDAPVEKDGEKEKEKTASDETAASSNAEDAAKSKSAEPTSTTEQTKDKEDVQMEDSSPAAAADKAKSAEPAKVNGAATAPHEDEDVKSASVSQLAIDGKEGEDAGSSQVDADVAMDEAPTSATKVSREREDDNVEEPAAKRAKTEPREDEPVAAEVSLDKPATAPTSEDETDPALRAFKSLPSWQDPDVNQREITPWRVREYKKVLAGAKKTKAGGGFKDAVVKMWPILADAYLARVEKPMDIGLMERNLRDGREYKTLGDLKNDLTLLYLNTLAFNGPTHEVTLMGRQAVDQVWAKLIDIPAEEPPKAKAPPKHNPTRHAEPRVATQPPPAPAAAAPRKDPRSLPASPAVAKGETDAYSVPPGGVPQPRRASTQNETDRPKRAIHPPKNRDIDYTAMQNFNKKKLSIELQFAYEVVNELMDPKHFDVNQYFIQPVDPVAMQIPNYWSIIKKPMDLSTMKNKFSNGEYQNMQQVQQDVKLIIANAAKFNGPDHLVTQLASQLGNIAKEQWAKKDQWIAKNKPAKSPSVASSVESEDESDDEQQGAGGAKNNPAPSSGTVAKLERRLADETGKLTTMFLNTENNDEAMIEVQRTVITAIRKHLIAEKEKLANSKSEKPAKSKPAKSGAKSKSGGGGQKKSGAAVPRKSGGSGGSKKKKVMNQAEKDAIANGINDLDENNISKAIDIIKKDTGQSENDSGELELEIDQLTNDALHKLWDLLKRVLPGFGKSLQAAREASPASDSPRADKKSGGGKKKNKPMNAREQEARIAELERLKNQYQSGQEPATDREPEVPVHPLREESSDSEEE